MAQAYYFTSTAVQTQLNVGISNSATSAQVASTVGWPTSYPYVIAIDYGGTTEELCTVTANNLGNLTITRGFDNTSAQTHGVGAVVRHVYCGNDANTAYTHFGNTAGVHGITGNVVGDSDTQTLTNKTLSSPTLSGTVGGTPTMPSGATYPGGTITGTWNANATLLANGAANVPLTVKGAASQTANLLAVQNNAAFNFLTVSQVGTTTFTPVNNSTVPMLVNASSGQTADLADFQVNGITQAGITAGGVLSAAGASLTPLAVGNVPLLIKGIASQTANYFTIQNSSAATLGLFNTGGDLILTPTGVGSTETYLSVTSPSGGSSTASLGSFTNGAAGGGSVLIGNGLANGTTTRMLNVTGSSLFSYPGNNGTSVSAIQVQQTATGPTSPYMVFINQGSTQVAQVDALGNLQATNMLGFSHTYTPTISGGGLTLGNGTMTAYYNYSGGTVTISIYITMGSTSSIASSGQLSFSLPSASLNPVGPAQGVGYFTKTSGGAFTSAMCTASGSSISFLILRQSDLTWQQYNSTNGGALASGSNLTLTISYNI